jgi:hypothetical protein
MPANRAILTKIQTLQLSHTKPYTVSQLSNKIVTDNKDAKAIEKQPQLADIIQTDALQTSDMKTQLQIEKNVIKKQLKNKQVKKNVSDVIDSAPKLSDDDVASSKASDEIAAQALLAELVISSGNS